MVNDITPFCTVRDIQNYRCRKKFTQSFLSIACPKYMSQNSPFNPFFSEFFRVKAIFLKGMRGAKK